MVESIHKTFPQQSTRKDIFLEFSCRSRDTSYSEPNLSQTVNFFLTRSPSAKTPRRLQSGHLLYNPGRSDGASNDACKNSSIEAAKAGIPFNITSNLHKPKISQNEADTHARHTFKSPAVATY